LPINSSGTNWLWDLTDEQGDGTQMWTLTTGNIGSFTKPSTDTCNSGQYEFYIWGLTKASNQKVDYSLFASDLSGQVYPTFYLSSEIKIIEKTDSNYGSDSNPFILIY